MRYETYSIACGQMNLLAGPRTCFHRPSPWHLIIITIRFPFSVMFHEFWQPSIDSARTPPLQFRLKLAIAAAVAVHTKNQTKLTPNSALKMGMTHFVSHQNNLLIHRTFLFGWFVWFVWLVLCCCCCCCSHAFR